MDLSSAFHAVGIAGLTFGAYSAFKGAFIERSGSNMMTGLLSGVAGLGMLTISNFAENEWDSIDSQTPILQQQQNAVQNMQFEW